MCLRKGGAARDVWLWLRQEVITPHYSQQNGKIERVIRTLKMQRAHRHRFEAIQYASRVLGD